PAARTRLPHKAKPRTRTLVSFGQTLYVDRVIAVDAGLGPVDLDDVPHVIGAEGLGVYPTIPPRIVLFRHQHIERAVLGEQPDGLIILYALLPAGTVRLAVLTELQIARKIDHLADRGDGLAGLR